MPKVPLTIEQYINHRLSSSTGTVGEIYGTEAFCHFIYSLVRMDRPAVVVELGCGCAATTLMAAKALNENGHGHCWTVDNGADWNTDLVRKTCQTAIGAENSSESYADYTHRLFETFGLASVITLIDMNLEDENLYTPDAPIDMLFADATPSGVEGCLAILKYYLPRVSKFSSIFIDRAGTINHSLLFLRYVVEQLNKGKIPWHLVDGLDEAQIAAVERLVRSSEFQLINLTESMHGKRNRTQNSRAWLKIQPVDYVPHNDVVSFGSITSPWEVR